MKKGWQTKNLGELCSFENGDRGENYPSKSVQTTSGVPFINAGHLSESGIDFSDMNYIPRERFELLGNGKIRKDDILFCLRGSLGKFASVGDLSEGAIASSLVIIRPSDAILNEFVLAYLQSDLCVEMIQEFRNGAAQPNLAAASLKKFSIPVPPLAEQQRIVGLLDEAFEGLATAKANAEKNLQNACALFESHLQSVFTQRGPGWVEKTLGNVVEFVGGSQPPKSVFSKTKKADNIRLIQIRDYKSDKHIVFIPRAQARRFCNADDVMIGRYGPPLFQILRGIEGAYNVALMKAVPDEAKLSRDFLFYFLKHSAILQYVIYHSSRAAGQIGVTKETLEPYPIALPSLAVQETVVENIQELDTETQHLARLYERKHAALEALKKSLLHQAFTGEL